MAGGGSLVVAGGGSLVVAGGGSLVVVVDGAEVVGGTVVDGELVVVVGEGLVLVGLDVVVELGALVVVDGRLVVGVPVEVLGCVVVGCVGVDVGGRPPVLVWVDDVSVASGIGTSPSSTVRMTRPPGSNTRCGTTAYGTEAVADGAKPRYGAGST